MSLLRFAALTALGAVVLAGDARAQPPTLGNVAAAPVDASVVPADAPAWQPISEAVAAVQRDSTVLLVHAYAVWCGWCTRVDREVYTDDAVQAYLAERFTVARLDVESPDSVAFFGDTTTMRALGTALGVRGTPTTAFFDPNGGYITMLPGFTPPARFLQILRFIGEGAYERMSFEEFTAAQGAPGG